MRLVFGRLRSFSLIGLILLTLLANQKVLGARKDSEASIQYFEDQIPRICPEDLPRAIEKIVNRPQFKRSLWGIEIQTLGSGDSLYSLNGDKFFTPASSAKLLTTAAALSELGADYRITTPIYAVGNPPHLTSLRIKGQGDPTISTKELKNLVHQLQRQGIKEIEELIVDDSYFDSPTINPTWEWLDVHSYFATAVNSTILNQNTVTLTLLPQQLGQPVKFRWSDAIAARQWQVINKAITGESDLPYNVEIDGDLGKPTLLIRGELAQNEPPDIWDLAIVDPAHYFLESLRLHLAQAGIAVNKGFTFNQTHKNELETELTAITSPPLPKILQQINQESNNLFAEAIAKILAKKLNTKTPIEAINQSLTKLGIDPEEYILIDASGLSRQNLITPQTLVKTLKIMSRSPEAEYYRESLAIAGVNGTLKNRFRNTSVSRKLWGKTGTLTGVVTLSGYIYPSQYPTIAFSILLNNSEISNREIRQAIDEIVVIINHLNKC
ncbi:D-alanyl-D-alanine carboxypeptidase/D-alanyl-D-alanine-endopeptidase [Pleurocapsa sp. PCC 7319]|uniref:D-alanyl-D-alanine carboxypeptidase/D-alanyl-D-alanine endopeptidase n=1 Tax=Pleurocapsa sp. PCC 7319 TaxID=118161 RepID=UPI00035E6D49|nr:D-alanyl-D-alanine carboxypeptidase/D-alanyl-D-alanine-endopeptidase [Pleurocapsa sp. PCC 7319]